MVHSINRIVKWAGIAVIPIGAVLFCQSYFLNQETVRRSVVSAVAAVLGMIPEGLYMLTTIALVLSTIRLARKKVLLHDMHSIEALARVDVLCVDKTGTITEPEMRVSRVQPLDEGSAETFHTRLCDYAAASIDNNATMLALKQYAQQELQRRPHTAERAVAMQPFSSKEKYGSVTFADGRYLLGAPEFVLREAYPAVAETLTPYSEAGGRVLLLARETENGAPEALGFVVLENPIRENAKQTFAYFKEQGVTVKVISGDNPVAVSRIAADAGIENAERWLDASAVHSDEQLVQAAESYTVFGRVTPQQKQLLVRALQDAGHTVAMTGDGVNDILAMKDADCSVAMASGSEAAAQSAQVVLLESDFARMPEVVLEGRRVVNNIQRSASLFLVKNIFSLMMALFSVIFMLTYPLEPSQISLISAFTIGIPGFLLALEPNKERIQGNFLRNVLLKALPAGLTDVLAVGALVVCGEVFSLPQEDIATAATMLLAVVGFMILVQISRPLNAMKYAILIGDALGLILCGIFLNQLFALNAMSEICVLLLIVFAFASESLFRNLSLLVRSIQSWLEKKRKSAAPDTKNDRARPDIRPGATQPLGAIAEYRCVQDRGFLRQKPARRVSAGAHTKIRLQEAAGLGILKTEKIQRCVTKRRKKGSRKEEKEKETEVVGWRTARSWRCTGSGVSRRLPKRSTSTADTVIRSQKIFYGARRTRRKRSAIPTSAHGTPCRRRGLEQLRTFLGKITRRLALKKLRTQTAEKRGGEKRSWCLTSWRAAFRPVRMWRCRWSCGSLSGGSTPFCRRFRARNGGYFSAATGILIRSRRSRSALALARAR